MLNIPMIKKSIRGLWLYNKKIKRVFKVIDCYNNRSTGVELKVWYYNIKDAELFDIDFFMDDKIFLNECIFFKTRVEVVDYIKNNNIETRNGVYIERK